MPFGIKDAVAKGEKTLALPTQLYDFHRRVGERVEMLFEPLQLFVRCVPDKVSHALDTLSELGKRDKILLFKFDGFLNAILVDKKVNTFRHNSIFNVKERFHDEVRPLLAFAVFSH